LCLLPQAGVAIGLAILSRQQFGPELGRTIILVVMTATFIMEILGPMMVKVGVKRAGEVGMNVTEQELIDIYTVEDIMETEPTKIPLDMPLQKILDVFSTTDLSYYPVVDADDRVTGIITIAGIKEMFANQDVAGWLLACDVTEPVLDKVTAKEPLEEALELMRRYDLEQVPVVAAQDDNRLVGILDHRKANRKISAEVLRRREAADAMGLVTG
ncbi:MAG: CBS domain-containing protein, partial [Planctomycetota bacterium]